MLLIEDLRLSICYSCFSSLLSYAQEFGSFPVKFLWRGRAKDLPSSGCCFSFFPERGFRLPQSQVCFFLISWLETFLRHWYLSHVFPANFCLGESIIKFIYCIDLFLVPFLSSPALGAQNISIRLCLPLPPLFLISLRFCWSKHVLMLRLFVS